MSLPGIGSTGALQEQPPEIAFVGAVNFTDDLQVYSTASFDIGAGDPERFVIVALVANCSLSGSTAGDSIPTDVLINGAPAALLASPGRLDRAGGISPYAISYWGRAIPSGTTASLQVTFPKVNRRLGVATFRLLASDPVPKQEGWTARLNTTNDITGFAVTIPITGIVVALNVSTTVNYPTTFTGAGSVEVYDGLIEGSAQLAVAMLASTGTLGVSANNDAGMVAAYLAW